MAFRERSLYRMVTGLARRAGVDAFTPHSFRHAFATDLVHRGVPLDKVMRLMGHESLETTQLYLGLTAGDLRDAIARLGGGSGPRVEVDGPFGVGPDLTDRRIEPNGTPGHHTGHKGA